MKSKCGEKLKEINAEVDTLQKELLAASRSYNLSSDEDQGSSSFKPIKRVKNGNSSKEPGDTGQNGDPNAFIGFSVEDPIRESIRSKSLQLSRKAFLNPNGYSRVAEDSESSSLVPSKSQTGLSSKKSPSQTSGKRGKN